MENNSFSLGYSINSWFNQFKEYPPSYGGIDFFCVESFSDIDFVASLAATFNGLRTDKGLLYEKVKIILPPGSNRKKLTINNIVDKIIEIIIKQDPSTKDLSGQNLAQLKKNFRVHFSSKLDIETCLNNEISEVVDIIKNVNESTAIILLDANQIAIEYSDVKPIHTTKTIANYESVRLWSPEDIWIKNVVSAIELINDQIKNRKLFLFIIVQQPTPAKEKNKKKLYAFDNINIYFGEKNPDYIILEEKISRWLKLATNQQVDLALSEIEDKVKHKFNKAIAKAQCLIVAHFDAEAFQEIYPFLKDFLKSPYPDFLISIAKILSNTGHRKLSLQFLNKAIKQNLNSQSSLNIALQIAKSESAHNELLKIRKIYEILYPTSSNLILDELYEAIEQNDYSKISEKLNLIISKNSTDDTLRFIYFLVNRFRDNLQVKDINNLLDKIKKKYSSFLSSATYYCGLYAFRQLEYLTALNLFTSNNIRNQMTEFAIAKIINVLGKIFQDMNSQTNQLPSENTQENVELYESIEKGLNQILKYIALNPNDISIRNNFYKLIAPQTSGLIAIYFLIKAVQNADKTYIKIVEKTKPELTLVESEDLGSILQKYYEKMEKPVLLGISKIPIIDIDYSKEQILETIDEFITELAVTLQIISVDEPIDYLFSLLHLSIKLHKELKTNREFETINTFATMLIALGNHQNARNLAEQSLIISLNAGDESKRSAWIVFSDIYQRCHNKVEALIGLACALHIPDVKISINEFFIQRILVIRLFRDFNFVDLALSEIDKIKIIADQTSNPERASLIIGVLEANIEFELITNHGSRNLSDNQIEDLIALANKANRLHKKAHEASNEVFPTALLIAQITRLRWSNKSG